jgi:hypothetical protein
VAFGKGGFSATLRGNASQSLPLRKRESDARFAQERLAYVETQLRNEQARREQEAREKAASEHWRYMSERLAAINRIVNPPRDPTAERIEALEWQLAAQAEQAENAAAEAAEQRRADRYVAAQAAAIARRDSR